MNVPLRINGVEMPKPQGHQICTLDKNCNESFENWDLLAIHITLVHNRNGRSREFWKGQPPQEVLNHKDWVGFSD